MYGDEINMTDEELAEAYDSASKFHFEPVDKWMEVAFCNNLNVRTGPSTDFRILRTVPCGTRVHIVARCVENGWYRIIANEKIVYQCGVYFKDFEGANELLIRTGDNANDLSKLTKKNKDDITDSDTETDIESNSSEEILDETSEETIVRTYGSLDVDLLKVGHHGSSTSSKNDSILPLSRDANGSDADSVTAFCFDFMVFA